MGFAATTGGPVRCWPEVANRADLQIGEAPGRAHQETLWGGAAGVHTKSPCEQRDSSQSLWLFTNRVDPHWMTYDLVFDIKPASASHIRALNDHVVNRVADGTSAIDLDRTHLNQHLHGDPAGPSASLAAFYGPKDDPKVKRPTAQAEAPYLRIVIGASPEYFRPYDPEARGTFDPDRMAAWRDRSLAWLRAEFGDDLVYADLHLDEDTPHIHAVIAPTYGRKPRRPGRRKRNETAEEFETRKRAAENGEVVRTVGRASHPTLSKPGSFQALREGLTACLSDLGIEYGNDRTPNAPDGMSTREWVARRTVELRRQHEALEARERGMKIREAILDRADEQLDAREAELDIKVLQIEERERRLRIIYLRVQEMLGAVADHLGVGRTLAAISAKIREHTFDNPSPESNERTAEDIEEPSLSYPDPSPPWSKGYPQ